MAIPINSIKPQSQLLAFSSRAITNKPISLKPPFNPNRALILPSTKPYKWRPAEACFSSQEIDMVKTRDGVYAANSKKVVILWDLDNKPPRGPPYEAARALKSMAEKFGDMIDMAAYANHRAFIHLPQWVVQDRREQRRHDALERKGMATAAESYICSVCGRTWRRVSAAVNHIQLLKPSPTTKLQ
ncbi:uncharacterized protein LOC131025461 [Salvia miltiorrhiza]|uniref:uncharacterized protein LOC131025461 n=1 Tax=Salvia miltiorrhiza TaxID=226208 RepID=UPI0025AD00CD|nr:uncharacterized protein LOC131025461 [Salvia miltiorrhiza]